MFELTSNQTDFNLATQGPHAMSELKTQEDLEAVLRGAVALAGGAKKWCRKNKIYGHDHSLHMITNGRGATFDDVMRVLGYRRVYRYEKIDTELSK